MEAISEHLDLSFPDYLEEDLDLCHKLEDAGVTTLYPQAVFYKSLQDDSEDSLMIAEESLSQTSGKSTLFYYDILYYYL